MILHRSFGAAGSFRTGEGTKEPPFMNISPNAAVGELLSDNGREAWIQPDMHSLLASTSYWP